MHGSNDNALVTGMPVTFKIGFGNASGETWSITNGFRIFSPDGATWGSSTTSVESEASDSYAISPFSANGSGADSVGIFTFISCEPFPNPIEHETFVNIQIGPIPEEHVGKTICLDSTFTPPGGIWQWSGQCNLTSAVPVWYGPYCFEITDQCCTGGITGNIDYDVDDLIDIGDLTRLIDYLFISRAPLICDAESNVDGSADGIIDIGDLTKLIGFLFLRPRMERALCP